MRLARHESGSGTGSRSARPPATPPGAPPRRRLARPSTIALASVAAALVAVGAAEWAGWPFLRGPFEHALAEATQREVHVGPGFRVTFLGAVRARSDELVIGPGHDVPTIVDEQGRPRDFLRAKDIRLTLTYATLWRQWRGTSEPLQVRQLDVGDLALNLRRTADGHANWQFGATAPASTPPSSAPRLSGIDELQVRHGEVRLQDDPMQVEVQAEVSTAEGIAPPLPASAAAPAASGASVAMPAVAVTRGLAVDARGSWRRQALVARLRSSGVQALAGSSAGSPAVPLWLDVRAGGTNLHVEGKGTDLLHFGGLDATFQGSGPSLAAVGDTLGVPLPTTAAFATRGRLHKAGPVWAAQVDALDIGSSRLHGDFHFDTAPAVPMLLGTLAGTRLALPDLGPAFGGAAPGQPKLAIPGHVLPAREFDIPSLRAMNADVGIALDTVDFGTDRLEPMHPLRAHLTLDQGVLKLADALARTSDGEVRGNIELDSRPTLPHWTADITWSGIQLQRFVKTHDIAAHGPAASQPAGGGYVSGELGGGARLQGTGRSTAALLGSLDGTVRLWVRKGTVSHLLAEAAGVDVAKSLGLYLTGDDALPMRCAVASLLVARGNVVPAVGVVDTRVTTLLVGGKLSLADETLGLRVTAHPHEMSPIAPRSPIDIDGRFAAPHVHLEAPPLALRFGVAAALATLNPLASLLGLVDWGEPEKDVCTAAVARVAHATPASGR